MARKAPAELYVGTISGTSVDGLDIALVDLCDGIRFVAAATTPLPAALRTTLLDLGQPGGDGLDAVGAADRALGEFIARAVLEFLTTRGIDSQSIRAIGSHGQTVRHRPDTPHPFTCQIGDPNCIAEHTGITTVADFRRRDMAAGGQGAPLVPPFHAALFAVPDEARAVLNIGGISNFTLLDDTGVRGFDCGPGNALLDSWCLAHQGKAFDADGRWAAGGTLLDDLLGQLLEDPFLHRHPPKSTGREHYNLAWLEPQLPREASLRDVQRTLLEFTAVSIDRARRAWAPTQQRVIVCGGGRLNPLLMDRLAALCDVPVAASEAHGVDGDAIEAAAFAWLARQRLTQAPGSAAAVTGAAGDRVLGAVYPGR